MAVLLLLSALALGAGLVRLIPLPLYRFEQAAMAVVLGLFVWSWVAFLVLLVLPYASGLPLLVLGPAAFAARALRRPARAPRPLIGGRRAWLAWGLATVITSLLIAQLMWTHSLLVDTTGVWSATSSVADYGLHASIITHIAEGSRLPMELSVAADAHMTYPFLVDLLSGLLRHGGFSLHASLMVPGTLLCIAICQLLIAFGLRLFGRMSVALGGLALALLTGSASGVLVAWDKWRESGQSLPTFLRHMPENVTLDWDRGAQLTNLLVDGIVPQRAIMFGLGAGLIALIFLLAVRDGEHRRLLWPAAALIGLLPMAHAHSFIVGMVWLATLAADAAWRRRAVPTPELGAIALALLLAAPQLAWQQLANGAGTGGRLELGWVMGDRSFLPFWAANFGLIGLGLLLVPFVMRRDRRLLWFVPMLGVLAATQVYVFQPTAYDNIKLIWWAYVIGGFYVVAMLVELIRRRRWTVAFIAPLAVLVVLPGALAITRDVQQRDMFANTDDMALAAWAEHATATDAVFAATDRSVMPIATLSGRRLVLGYRQWLSNFSIDATDRETAVRAALAGNFDDPALHRYGADYLVVNGSEPEEWKVDRKALERRRLVWKNTTWQVYDLHAPATQAANTPVTDAPTDAPSATDAPTNASAAPAATDPSAPPA